MRQQQTPEWWGRKNEARIGCADVTIVSIASIAAFVILVLVLIRSDFANIFERVPGANSSATSSVTGAKPAATPTSQPDNNAIGPIVPATTAAPAANSPQPNPPQTTQAAQPPANNNPPSNNNPPAPTTPTSSVRKLPLLSTCTLRPEPTTSKQGLGKYTPGTVFIILGNERINEKINWINVEVDDGSSLQGWMWAKDCFGQ